MELNRLNTREALNGVNIDEEMSADEIKEQLSQYVPPLSTPEIPSPPSIDVDSYISNLDTVINAESTLKNKLSEINDLKLQIKEAKTVLDTANNVYAKAVKTQTNIMDITPCINGKPLMTGSGIVLEPLQVGVDTGTTTLQQLETQLDTGIVELLAMQDSVKEMSDSVIKSIIESISLQAEEITPKVDSSNYEIPNF